MFEVFKLVSLIVTINVSGFDVKTGTVVVLTQYQQTTYTQSDNVINNNNKTIQLCVLTVQSQAG